MSVYDMVTPRVCEESVVEELALPGDWSFDAFFVAAFPRLVGAMTLYCGGNHSQGEEIAQEALARACRDWSTVRTTTSPDAWVHRVALNLANSWFRRLRTHRRREHLLATREGESLESNDAPDLLGALGLLTPRQRQAIVLRYYADLSVAEAASAMRCAEGTVRALTAQGVDGLRRQLGEIEVTDHDS